MDIGSMVRLGATIDNVAGDGTVNFNGLLDSVQFYGQALSASQATSLYQGSNLFGSLPTSTNMTIAVGATLDLNGAVQQIGSLCGAMGSSVKLGNGQLIVNSSANTQFSGSISGSGGSLVKQGIGVLTLTGANSYTGSTTISGGTLQLGSQTGTSMSTAAVANYTFENVVGSTVTNLGTGGAAMNGTLTGGGATIVAGGHAGNAVSLSGGASVNINSPITDLGSAGFWTVSAWVKTSTPGGSILDKSNGSGWTTGNSIFYLGDGASQGSGGIPSAVRFAGGFFQGSTGAVSVTDNAWHQVIYIDNGGAFGIYVDGVLQSLSSGNSSFSNADVGSTVRLGVTTDNVPADGTVNFSGLLDDVQIYSQALSADQVASLFQGQTLSPLPITTSVSIASGATLDVNGRTQQVAALSGPAGSTVTLGNGQLIISSATSTVFSGIISGPGGSLVKQDSGTLTLAGTNSYTGATMVNGGILAVNGSITSPVTVNASGGLQGSGNINSSVIVASGATLTPGNFYSATNVPGTLTISGATTLNNGATLNINLGGEIPAQFSQLHVNGQLTVGASSTLSVSLVNGFQPLAGDMFDIADWGALSGSLTAPSSSLNGRVLWDSSLLNTTGVLSVAATFYAGDFNRDSHVDASDLLSMMQALTNPVGYEAADNVTTGELTLIGDINGDGVFNNTDVQSLLNLLKSGGGSSDAVPEPSSFLLLAAGAIAWLIRRWLVLISNSAHRWSSFLVARVG
jgi:autotransporter-associated beta strand protein